MAVFTASAWRLRVLLALVAAFASHHICFRRGEWHLKSATICIYYLGACGVLAVCELSMGGDGRKFVMSCTAMTGTYLIGLFASMMVYRAYFHRLDGFPGPYGARLTKLWHVLQILDSKNHLFLDLLHNEFGDFVRTGPSELTIFDPEVLSAIDGYESGCSKSAWYDALHPETLVNTMRDKKLHSKRRRIWSHAFTKEALSTYDIRIMRHVRKLEAIIDNHAGRSVDASVMFYEFSFGLMGDFAFERTQDDGGYLDENWCTAIVALNNGMRLLGPLSPVPWLLHLCLRLRFIKIVQDWHQTIRFCQSLMQTKLLGHGGDSDVSSWLIRAYKHMRYSREAVKHGLYGDAITMMIAGSNTIAPVLVFLFYHVALFPEKANIIRVELENLGSAYDTNALLNLPYLSGFIKETLRLFPATPTGGARDTPPEGVLVGGRWIPGGTTVVAPAYNIGRLAKCFVRPREFIPERWVDLPHLVRERQAFTPFKQGAYSCIGKQLALTELSIVLARVLSFYQVRIPPEYDIECVVREMKDCFTAKPGKLCLIFNPIVHKGTLGGH